MLVEKLEGGLILHKATRRIVGIWDTALEQGQGVEPHHHEDLEELYYIISGRGRMNIEEEERVVEEREVIYIPPEKVHHGNDRHLRSQRG